MSLVVGLLAVVGIFLWPERFDRCRLAIMPSASTSVRVPRSVSGSRRERAHHWRRGRGTAGIGTQDLLALLEAIAPALEVGMAPATALRIAADARAEPGGQNPLEALVKAMASAAADGTSLGPLWREAAESSGSAELLMLAQA